MKINLTKLLDITSRVVYIVEPQEGTTSDTAHLKKQTSTGEPSPYMFEQYDSAGINYGAE